MTVPIMWQFLVKQSAYKFKNTYEIVKQAGLSSEMRPDWSPKMSSQVLRIQDLG